MPVSNSNIGSLQRISESSDISYKLILVAISSSVNSEDTGEILAAVIVCCAPQLVSASSPSGYCHTGQQNHGWQLADLAAPRFARACLAASELPVHWVTLRRWREQ